MKENNLKVIGSYGIFSSKKIDGKLIIEDNIISTKEDFIYKFINNDDYIGAFALSYKSEIFKEKEYLKILEELLNNRIVEAGAEYLEDFVSKNIWKINIRPAIGYPSLPKHQLKETVLKILDGDKLDIKLTSSYAMLPLSSVCGLYISNPKSFYKK